jgi:hypothetical protein
MKKHIAPLILCTLLAVAPVLQIVAQSSSSMIGKTDIPALIEEAPAAPITLEEAARRTYGPNLLQPDHHALQNYYQPFLNKIVRNECEEAWWCAKLPGLFFHNQNHNRIFPVFVFWPLFH